MFYYGHGVPQNYHKALKWFRKSADQGNEEAQTHLGHMYYQGECELPQRDVLAMEWYH